MYKGGTRELDSSLIRDIGYNSIVFFSSVSFTCEIWWTFVMTDMSQAVNIFNSGELLLAKKCGKRSVLC